MARDGPRLGGCRELAFFLFSHGSAKEPLNFGNEPVRDSLKVAPQGTVGSFPHPLQGLRMRSGLEWVIRPEHGKTITSILLSYFQGTSRDMAKADFPSLRALGAGAFPRSPGLPPPHADPSLRHCQRLQHAAGLGHRRGEAWKGANQWPCSFLRSRLSASTRPREKVWLCQHKLDTSKAVPT